MARIDRSRVEQMIVSQLRTAMAAAASAVVVTVMGEDEPEMDAGSRTARMMVLKVTSERDGGGGAADLEVVVVVRMGAMVSDNGTTIGSRAVCAADAQRVVNSLARIGLEHAASTHIVNIFGGDVEEVETANPLERAMVVRFTGMVTRVTGETVAF